MLDGSLNLVKICFSDGRAGDEEQIPPRRDVGPAEPDCFPEAAFHPIAYHRFIAYPLAHYEAHPRMG